MPSFDVDINIVMSNIASLTSQIANLEQRISSLETKFSSLGNSVNAAETRIQSSVAQSNNTLNSFWANIQSGSTRASTAFNAGSNTIVAGSNRINQALQQTQQISAQSALRINELGIAGSRAVPSLQQLSGALAQMNAGANQISTGLGRASASMDNAQRSGNRLAEIFRGNRGLVFGFSALFGTLTGIAFELQLVTDANAQVAESQAALNELVKQGREGTAQYSQAQQALGKDQRFLEFSTRNLALAFTNLIPDLLLIINGVLSLRDRVQGVAGATGFPMMARATRTARAELVAFGETAGIVNTELKALQATSASPLGWLGGMGGTGGGLGAAAKGGGIMAAIKAALPIGGPLALAGAGAAMFFPGMPIGDSIIKQVNDRILADNKIRDSNNRVQLSYADLAAKVKAGTASVEESVKVLANNIKTHNDGMIESNNNLIASFPGTTPQTTTPHPRGQTWEDIIKGSGGPTDNSLFGTGGGGGTGDYLGKGSFLDRPVQDKQAEATARLYQDESANMFPDSTIGPNVLRALGVRIPSTTGTTFSQDLQTIISQANKTRMISPDMAKALQMPEFGGQGFQGQLTTERLAEMVELSSDIADAQDKINQKRLAGQTANAVDLVHLQLLKEKVPELLKNKDALDEEIKMRKIVTDAQNKYNTLIESEPRILQETGQVHKFLTSSLYNEQKVLLDSAAAYVDYGGAQQQAGTLTKQQEGLLKGIVAEGNRVVTSLYEQRDAIQGANIFWEQMNATTKEQIATTQEQVLGSIDVTQAMTNQTYQQYLVNQGLIAGVQEAKAFIDTEYQMMGQTEGLNAGLQTIADAFGVDLPNGIQITNEEFKKVLDTLVQTGNGALALEQIMTDKLAPSFEKFSDILGATSKKAFGEAWKAGFEDDGSLVGVPKKLRSAIKDIGQDAIEVNKHVRDATNTVDALLVAAANNRQQGSKSGIKALIDDIKDIPGSNLIQPFIDHLKTILDLPKEERTQALLAFVDAFNAFKTAISEDSPGGTSILAGEANDINAHVNALEADTKAMNDNIDARKKLGPLYSIISTKPEVGGRKLTAEEEKALYFGGGGGMDVWRSPTGPSGGFPGGGFDFGEGKDGKKGVSDPQAAATKQQTEANNQLAITLNQLKVNTEALTKANNVYAKTVVQVYKDVILQTAGNNVLDSTIAQIIIDTGLWVKSNNLLDRTVAQLIKDINLYVKANNIYDRTVAQLITDEGLLSKTTAALTKATQASDKAFDNAASAAKNYAAQLKKVESQARATAKAINSIPSGGGGSSAQGGMHTNLQEDTVILAHAGERVDIGPGTQDGNIQSRARGRGGGGGDTIIHLTEHNHIILNGEEIEVQTNRKTFKRLNSR